MGAVERKLVTEDALSIGVLVPSRVFHFLVDMRGAIFSPHSLCATLPL